MAAIKTFFLGEKVPFCNREVAYFLPLSRETKNCPALGADEAKRKATLKASGPVTLEEEHLEPGGQQWPRARPPRALGLRLGEGPGSRLPPRAWVSKPWGGSWVAPARAWVSALGRGLVHARPPHPTPGPGPRLLGEGRLRAGTYHRTCRGSSAPGSHTSTRAVPMLRTARGAAEALTHCAGGGRGRSQTQTPWSWGPQKHRWLRRGYLQLPQRPSSVLRHPLESRAKYGLLKSPHRSMSGHPSSAPGGISNMTTSEASARSAGPPLGILCHPETSAPRVVKDHGSSPDGQLLSKKNTPPPMPWRLLLW